MYNRHKRCLLDLKQMTEQRNAALRECVALSRLLSGERNNAVLLLAEIEKLEHRLHVLERDRDVAVERSAGVPTFLLNTMRTIYRAREKLCLHVLADPQCINGAHVFERGHSFCHCGEKENL
jgi:hypothetical protein